MLSEETGVSEKLLSEMINKVHHGIMSELNEKV